MKIIYVNEYQPSSAKLQINQDPIYSRSLEQERIRVGTPLSSMPIFLVAIALLLVMK